MASNNLGTTAPTNHAFPPETVLLVPAPLPAVPLRPPAGAWGLVVVAVRTTDATAPDPARTDTADLLAGVWLPTRPPAHLHTGDVVVRLQPPYASPPHNGDDPAQADVVVLAADEGEWRTIRTWTRSIGAR